MANPKATIWRSMKPLELAEIVAKLKEVCSAVVIDGVSYADYVSLWSDMAVTKALSDAIPGINTHHVHRVRVSIFGNLKPKPKPKPEPKPAPKRETRVLVDELAPSPGPGPFGIWMSLMTSKGHEGSPRVFVDLAEDGENYTNAYPVAMRYYMIGSNPRVCLFRYQHGGQRLYTFDPHSVTYSNSCMLIDAGILTFPKTAV